MKDCPSCGARKSLDDLPHGHGWTYCNACSATVLLRADGTAERIVLAKDRRS